MTTIFHRLSTEEEVPEGQIEPSISKGTEEVPESSENTIFHRLAAQPLTKEEKIASQFKFFGKQPSPETIRKIRQPTGVALKGFAKGLIGTPGELLSFAQQLAGVKKPLKVLPTTEDIGNMFEKLSGEEFKPENIGEEFADRGFEFLGSIIGLGGPLKATTTARTLGRNVLAAFAPAGVSLFTEKAKLPPWAQVAATVGTSFLTHRLTGKGLRDIERALYSQSRELAGDAKVSSKNMIARLGNVEKKVQEGISTPTTKKITQSIKELEGQVKGGTIDVQRLLTSKQRLNENIRSAIQETGFQQTKESKGLWKMLGGAMDDTVKDFEKTNPKFKEVYRQANSLHKGLAETAKIGKWLKSNKLLSGTSGLILKLALPGFLKPSAIIAGTAQTGQFLKALAKNSGYRKAYFEVLKNAAKEDARATASSLKKFNKQTEEILPDIDQS